MLSSPIWNVERTRMGVRALLMASAALAATPAAARQAEPEKKEVVLEEIIVEARRTTENVQDVPVTVNVVSGEALEAKGITQLSNIASVVPNMVWIDGGGGTFTNRMTLRGIYSNATSQGFDPGVAVYLDDVYIGNHFGFNSALLDIDRVEVLKGPQGTLFGRNAAAGAISVHTARPSLTERSTTLAARVGDYGLREGRALVNLPLSDQAALKLSAIYRDRAGYQRNSVTGKRNLNDERFHGGRAQLLLTPTDDVELLATVEYFRNDDHQSVLSCVAAPGALPCPNATRDAVFKDIAADNGSSTERKTWAATLKADWNLAGDLKLSAITAYRDLKVEQDQDQDYSSLDGIHSGYLVPKDWQFSEEVKLATDQAARLRGVAGLYYFHEDRTTNIPLSFSPTLLAIVGAKGAPSRFEQLTSSRLKTTSLAAFGQGQFDIRPNLTAELGLRYARDDKRFTYGQTENAILSYIPEPLRNALYLVPFATARAKADFSKPTYTASISWKPVEAAMTYVRYATGFKAGGFASATNSPNYNPLAPFRPENSGQWEVGLKTKLFSGRARANIAAFRTRYEDMQVQTIDPVTFQKVVGNLGSARSKGVEMELAAALAEGLSIDGAVGLQRSRYVRGPAAGREFQYAPKFTANFSINHEHQLVGEWRAATSITFIGQSAMNLSSAAPGSASFLRSPGVLRINARLGVEREDGRLGVYLWGQNLTDERRFTDFVSQGPVQPPAYQMTTPRTLGVELRSTF